MGRGATDCANRDSTLYVRIQQKLDVQLTNAQLRPAAIPMCLEVLLAESLAQLVGTLPWEEPNKLVRPHTPKPPQVCGVYDNC
jgi:hypothetical protein